MRASGLSAGGGGSTGVSPSKLRFRGNKLPLCLQTHQQTARARSIHGFGGGGGGGNAVGYRTSRRTQQKRKFLRFSKQNSHTQICFLASLIGQLAAFRARILEWLIEIRDAIIEFIVQPVERLYPPPSSSATTTAAAAATQPTLLDGCCACHRALHMAAMATTPPPSSSPSIQHFAHIERAIWRERDPQQRLALQQRRIAQALRRRLR